MDSELHRQIVPPYMIENMQTYYEEEVESYRQLQVEARQAIEILQARRASGQVADRIDSEIKQKEKELKDLEQKKSEAIERLNEVIVNRKADENFRQSRST